MARVVFGVTIPITAASFLRVQMGQMASRGWDVHLVSSPGSALDELAQALGVTVHALPMAREPRPLRDGSALGAWIRLLRKLRPDLVVASTPKAGLLGMLAARFAGVPHRVYHLRGLRAQGLHGALRAVSLASERVTIRNATDVLCDSPSLLDELRALGLLRRDQGVVLGAGSCCGIDVTRFRPPSCEERETARLGLGLPSEAVVIGFVGRLTEDKGVAELLTAVEGLAAADPRVHLVLAGPNEAGPDLEARLATIEASPRVHIVGPVSDPRLVYWATDIFALPSYREGFPIAPLEAQACGLPVVTTTATGCRDAVQPGVTGITIEPRDASALADALRTLIDDPGMRLQFSADARLRTVHDFTDASVVQGQIAYLETVTNGPR